MWLSGGLADSTLGFQEEDSSPVLYHYVFSLDKKLYSPPSLFTQVYKWVPVTVRKTKGVTDSPSRERVVLLVVALCYRNLVKLQLCGLPVAQA